MVREPPAMEAVHIRLSQCPLKACGMLRPPVLLTPAFHRGGRIHCLPRCVLLQGWNCCPKPNPKRG